MTAPKKDRFVVLDSNNDKVDTFSTEKLAQDYAKTVAGENVSDGYGGPTSSSYYVAEIIGVAEARTSPPPTTYTSLRKPAPKAKAKSRLRK